MSKRDRAMKNKYADLAHSAVGVLVVDQDYDPGYLRLLILVVCKLGGPPIRPVRFPFV
jgi:hypothetical protein